MKEPERQIFTTGLALPEAPLLLPDGSWLVAELAFDSGRVVHVSADGSAHHTIAETGRPNGLAIDRAGDLWICETLYPSVIQMRQSGEVVSTLTDVDGVALLWPNDLCFGPDRALYFTDSGLLVHDFLDADGAPVDGSDALPMDGKIVRLDPATGEARILDDGYRFANGIAFGPDDRLYTNETMTGNVYRYELREGGDLGERELFGTVLDPAWSGSGLRGPDGMAFATDGRLFVTVFGQGDVTVLDLEGEAIERVRTQGRAPTNVAFGRDGERRIYVVEDQFGQIEAYDVGIDGFALYD